MAKVKTAGVRGPDNHAYFVASNVSFLEYAAQCHQYLLVAVNEIKTDEELAVIEGWIEDGRYIFVDSGIYSLAMEHARRHNTTHDVALNLAPEDIDGFEQLWDRYLYVMKRIGDTCWGYIELDQGGKENKRKTRAKLEAEGLRPIPVYHPFGDGWEYFDELAERYDRICIGNVVQADRNTRRQLVATAWERHRKYPDLWIHLLGLTPNEWLNAFPINSGDSSAWLATVRWSGYKPKAAGAAFGDLPRHFQYQLGVDPHSEIGHRKAVRMGAYGAYMLQCNWRNHLNRLEELGFDLYPAPSEEGSDAGSL